MIVPCGRNFQLHHKLVVNSLNVPAKSRVLLIAADIRQNFFVMNFALVLVSVRDKNDSNETNLSLFDRMTLLILRCLLFPR